MSGPNNGRVFTTFAGDTSSKVNLFNCPHDISQLLKVVNNVNLIGLIDNDGEREAIVVHDSNKLDIYTIDPDVPSITLTSSTSFTAGSVTDWLGVKKVSGSQYNIYNYYYVSASPATLAINVIAVAPGGGHTHTTLSTISFPAGVCHFDMRNYQVKIIDKVAYFMPIMETAGSAGEHSVDVYKYQLNMLDDSVTGDVEWSSGIYKASRGATDVGDFLVMMENLGVIHWFYCCFVQSGSDISFYLVENGTPYFLFTQLGSTIADWSIAQFEGYIATIGAGFNLQYNLRDFLVGVIWYNTPADVTYKTTMDSDGTLVVTLSPPDEHLLIYPPPVETGYFRSSSYFPVIMYNQDDDTLYWADYTTGLAVSPFTVSGVSEVWNLFPRLDIIVGSIYADCDLGGSDKRYGLNPSSAAIVSTIDSDLGNAYDHLFNHGNFFIGMSADKSTALITYLAFFPETPNLFMMIEMN